MYIKKIKRKKTEKLPEVCQYFESLASPEFKITIVCTDEEEACALEDLIGFVIEIKRSGD